MFWKCGAYLAKAVEISGKDGTIGPSGQNGERIVRDVCRLDIEKYRCVSQNIVTDEVIITEERIVHIQQRHPQDYERYAQYMSEMIQKPQYILEDPFPNTAVILRSFSEANKQFRLILKLAVTNDGADKKNSVITFMKISEKTFRKYVRNKNILYKSE